jgi:hypothetical protein
MHMNQPPVGELLRARESLHARSLEEIEAAVARGESGPALDRRLDAAAAVHADIEQLRRAESAVVGRCLPVSVGRAAAPVHAPAVITRRDDGAPVPAGTALAQFAIARTVAHRERVSIDSVAERLFPDAQGVMAIARTAVGAADTTTQGWAAELVRSETRGILQTDLAPISIAAALAVRGVRADFAGAQSAAVPTISLRDTTTAGAWVGEGGVIPLVKGSIAAARLSRYKLAGIIPMTKELDRSSDPAAVEVMRKLLVQSTANLLDSCLLDSLPAVAGVRPAGLMFGITPTAGAAGGGAAAVLADIETLVGALIAAGLGAKPVLLVNPLQALVLSLMTNAMGEFVFADEVARGRLRLADIVASPAVPAGTVIAVAAEIFASAFDAIELDLNDSATLTMANADGTAPTQAGAAPGGGALGTPRQVVPDGGIEVSGGVGSSVSGAVAMSLWQTWSLAIRLIVPASWNMLRAGGVAAVNGVTW